MADPSRPSRLRRDDASVDRPFRVPAAPPAAADPVAAAAAEAAGRGYAEGRAAGEAELAGAIREFHARAAAALSRLAEIEAAVVRDLEHRLLDVALAAASRVVRERIEAGDPVAVRALREALDAVPASGEIRVRVHPDDAEAIGRETESEVARGRIVLVPDPSIGRGGCVVESAVGTVDATVGRALEAVCTAGRGGA